MAEHRRNVTILLLIGTLAGLATLAGCANRSTASNAPHIYRGGQYYEDAVHPDSQPR